MVPAMQFCFATISRKRPMASSYAKEPAYHTQIGDLEQVLAVLFWLYIPISYRDWPSGQV